jgi:hypothetical protein
MRRIGSVNWMVFLVASVSVRRGRMGGRVLVMLRVMLDAAVRMAGACLDLLPIVLRRHGRQGLDQGRQIPDRLVIHAAFRPRRHAGCLDAVLDDPEAARIGPFVRGGAGGLVGQVGWRGRQSLANFRIAAAWREVAADAHGLVI